MISDLEGLAKIWNKTQSVFEIEIFWQINGDFEKLLAGEFYVELIRDFQDEDQN